MSDTPVKVMIVDDDVQFLDMMTQRLKKTQLSVKTLSDARKALKEIQEFLPNVILLDIQMPHFDGFDILCELKTNPDTTAIPVIVVTGGVSEGLSEYVQYYLVKPFTPAQAIDKINEVLNISSSEG